MPSATSSAMEPVGMTATGARSSLPRRMTEPLPNWRSIWASAVSRAFSRSVVDGIEVSSFVALDAPSAAHRLSVPEVGRQGWRCVRRSGATVRAATDSASAPQASGGERVSVGRLWRRLRRVEQGFEGHAENPPGKRRQVRADADRASGARSSVASSTRVGRSPHRAVPEEPNDTPARRRGSRRVAHELRNGAIPVERPGSSRRDRVQRRLRATSRPRPCQRSGRHVVGLAERRPDVRGGNALVEGPGRGAAVELVDDELVHQHPAVRLAELLVDGSPELADLHRGSSRPISAPPGRGGGRRSGRSARRSRRAAHPAPRGPRGPRAGRRPRA